MGNLLYWRAFGISCHVTLSGMMSVSIHEVYDAVARGGASCVSTKVVSTCLENVCASIAGPVRVFSMMCKTRTKANFQFYCARSSSVILQKTWCHPG